MYYFYEIIKDPNKPGTYELFGPLQGIYKAAGDNSNGYVQVIDGKPVVHFKEHQILKLGFPLK